MKTTKKIGIFSDTHGNLPALTTILTAFEQHKVDEIIHCGDIISIGPHSKQCLELLLNTKNITLVAGNHDLDFAFGRNKLLPGSHVSAQHKTFVFDSIGEEFRQKVAEFPIVVHRKHGDRTFTFCHYALRENYHQFNHKFMPLENHPTAQKFDEIFAFTEGDVIFFGHKHEPCHIVGKKTYIDVGSLGCHPNAFARGIILHLFDDFSFEIQHLQLTYDREALYKAVLDTKLPDGKYTFEFYFDHLHQD